MVRGIGRAVAAPEHGEDASGGESSLAAARHKHGGHRVHRSSGTGGCHRSPEPASRAGCALWVAERYDILYALRRLVSTAVCHNLNHGIAVARPRRYAHDAPSYRIGAGFT